MEAKEQAKSEGNLQIDRKTDEAKFFKFYSKPSHSLSTFSLLSQSTLSLKQHQREKTPNHQLDSSSASLFNSSLVLRNSLLSRLKQH
jgi:hypothetical protein